MDDAKSGEESTREAGLLLPGVADTGPADPPPAPDSLLDTKRAREERDTAAAAEKARAALDAAAEEPELAAVIQFKAPRGLVADQTPERVQSVTAPEPYRGMDFTLWINPSAAYVSAVAEQKPLLRDFMWQFLRGWTLMFAPAEEGGEPEPVPFEYDHSVLVTEDVWGWLAAEFHRLRTNPLAAVTKPSSENVRETRLIGGDSKATRNGSG